MVVWICVDQVTRCFRAVSASVFRSQGRSKLVLLKYMPVLGFLNLFYHIDDVVRIAGMNVEQPQVTLFA